MSQTASQTRTLVNKKGREVTTPYTDGEAFKVLEQQMKDGNASQFAVDLIYKGRKYGLSEEQFWWIHRLAIPEPPLEIKVPNIRHSVECALEAGVKAKNIKKRFDLPEGNVVVAMAGPRSKHYGTIFVTDDGVYPDNKYYGKIDAHGIFTGRNTPEFVQKLIVAINDNVPAHFPW